MSSDILFSTYRSGIVTLSSDYISEMLQKDYSAATNYLYTDTFGTGLSFMKIANKLLILDQSFPVVKAIVSANFVINFNASANDSFVDKLIFTNTAAEYANSANWKSINDILMTKGYTGPMPIKSVAEVYMLLVNGGTPKVIPSTLFTPDQPFIQLSLAGAATDIVGGASTAIKYNTLDDSRGDAIVPILTTGTDQGKVTLAVPGVYIVEASFELDLTGTTVTDNVITYIELVLNGTSVSRQFGAVKTVSTTVDGGAAITAIIGVKESDLITANKAVLQVFGLHTSSTTLKLAGASKFTNLNITFLG